MEKKCKLCGPSSLHPRTPSFYRTLPKAGSRGETLLVDLIYFSITVKPQTEKLLREVGMMTKTLGRGGWPRPTQPPLSPSNIVSRVGEKKRTLLTDTICGRDSLTLIWAINVIIHKTVFKNQLVLQNDNRLIEINHHHRLIFF